MDRIFLLKKMPIDIMFGEHSREWQVVGWTDDLSVAQRWRQSSHRDEHRTFDVSQKASAESLGLKP